MTFINAFFYLMLIICGAAVAIILNDLKKAEDRALAAMSRLQDDHGRTKLGQNSDKNISSQKPNRADTRRQISEMCVPVNHLAGFLTVADGSAQTERDCAYQVQFDFSAVRSNKRKEQTVTSLPVYSEQSDCCA